MTDFAFSFNCIVSPGIAKVLTRATGASERVHRSLRKKPRPPRTVTKRLNREARAARWELVHLAGCTEHHCATNWWLELIDEGDLPPRRVSVPRSLRPLLGRYIGGRQ